MSKVYYVGELPPPYGGVTVKNKLLYSEIKKFHDAKMIDLMSCKRIPMCTPFVVLKLITVYLKKGTIIYGIGSMQRLKTLIRIQNLFGDSVKKTIIIAMGGTFSKKILADPILDNLCRKVTSIWVETEGMKQSLVEQSYQNVSVFPNPKTGKGACEPKLRRDNEPLKLLYFSQISEQKGVDDIMKVARKLNQKNDIQYELEFYGHVVDDYREKFEQFIKSTDNVRYIGVFDATKADIYQKLNEFDILLFPTHWKAEGVPGILVEAKMAGLAVIASNMNYNREIINEKNNEGVILKEDIVGEMEETIRRLYRESETLMNMKKASFQSRKRYELEEYKEMFRKII